MGNGRLRGGDGGSGTSNKKQGLFSEPEDTTKQAKRGGTYGHFNANDETNLDPFTTPRGAGQGGFERPGYQKLLREKEFRLNFRIWKTSRA